MLILNYIFTELLILFLCLRCLVHILNTFISYWTLTGDLMSSVIGTLGPSLLQASLPLCQHFLAHCIHQGRSLHASSPLMPLSVSHPIPRYKMKGKPWCLWGWLAAVPEVERWEQRERGDKGKGEEIEKRKRTEKKAACSDCKLCEKGKVFRWRRDY